MEKEDVMDFRKITREDDRRRRRLEMEYDPVKGVGCCGRRVKVDTGDKRDGVCMLPVELLEDKDYKKARSRVAYVKARCRHDFEYWAVTCACIKDKLSGRDIPFRLNGPQRKLLAVMERMRREDKPVRVILLKARQWGGSTLVQVYMAWWQTVLYTNCHSLICSQVKDTSATIRGMYSKLLANYPEEYWEGAEQEPKEKKKGNKATSARGPRFRQWEGALNVREIVGRNCHVTVSSIENQDAVRGGDYAMAHLSEVAFWRDTTRKSPDEMMRAIGGGIHNGAGTLLVMESTANGTGSFFHREWQRSVAGESDKEAVFVGWHEIEIYRMRVADRKALWDSLDDYERGLWEMGLSLDQIGWYHHKRREYGSHSQMKAEFPTTAMEAFVHSGSGVFGQELVERLREGCEEPAAFGELTGRGLSGAAALRGVKFVSDSSGKLKVWEMPVEGQGQCAGERYVVGVDIGGVSDGADWSVITVMDCGLTDDYIPRVVACWRGHIDHDLLGWKCAQIARWYGDALLVVESNTLESEHTDGDPSGYILNRIGEHYRNLYHRAGVDGKPGLPGFHMNRATKTWAIAELVGRVREGTYVERDTLACNELLTYERQPNGSMGARPGCHDDLLMTRALIFAALPSRRVTPVGRIGGYIAGL